MSMKKTLNEKLRQAEEWVKKNYPENIYQPHEIAIAHRAYQAGLLAIEEE